MTDSGGDERAQAPLKSPGRLTPRQVDVLELASIGLSDEEIAARLRISARMVRFQFEKAFARLGVRDRAQAVTIWSGRSESGRVPADRCPYHRPFRTDFAECPTYRAQRIVTLDTQHRPTGCVWTCRNLEVGRRSPDEERWYARCAIGTAASRERQAAEFRSPGRLQAENVLAVGLAGITAPMLHRLWPLKVAQQRARREGRASLEATSALGRLKDQYIADLAEFLSRRRFLLDRYGLSAHACLETARRAMESLVPEEVPAEWSGRLDALLGLAHEAWPSEPAA